MAAAKPELLRFTFDDFKRKSDNANKVSQHASDCHGCNWKLTLRSDYPTIVLRNLSKSDIDVTLSIVLRDAKGRVAKEQRRGIQHFEAFESHSFLFLLEWSKIINQPHRILKDEKLVVEVEMHRISKIQSTPPNPFAKNLIKLINDEDTADVAFKVCGTTIYAHRVLLQANAPVLASFCSGCDINTPIPLEGISPTNFLSVIRYVYGGEVPIVDLIEKQGLELLGAANRYVLLKLLLSGNTLSSLMFSLVHFQS